MEEICPQCVQKTKVFNRDEVAVLLTLAMIFRVQWRRLHKPEILGAEDNDVCTTRVLTIIDKHRIVLSENITIFSICGKT